MGLLPGGTDLGPGGAVCLRHAAGTRRRTGPGAGNGTQGDGGIREDGGLSFLCDGAPVGGVQTLDCPGADQVDWDDLTGYKEVLPTLWSQFLEEGEGTPDYIASPAAGSGADLEVSLVTDQRSESHYLFAAGDQVYDLWFSDPNPLPSYDVSGTVRSFALQSK